MNASAWCHSGDVRGEGSGRQIDQLWALGQADGPPGPPVHRHGMIRLNTANHLCRLLSVEMSLTKAGSPASDWQQGEVDLRQLLVLKLRTGVTRVPAPPGALNNITKCRSPMRASR
jgi:hypothetical protein